MHTFLNFLSMFKLNAYKNYRILFKPWLSKMCKNWRKWKRKESCAQELESKNTQCTITFFFFFFQAGLALQLILCCGTTPAMARGPFKDCAMQGTRAAERSRKHKNWVPHWSAESILSLWKSSAEDLWQLLKEKNVHIYPSSNQVWASWIHIQTRRVLRLQLTYSL